MTLANDSAEVVINRTWIDTQAGDLLDELASMLGADVQVVERGNAWHVGRPSESDLETRVYNIPTSPGMKWDELVKIAAGKTASTVIAGDYLIVRDTPLALQRWEPIFARLMKERRSWHLDCEFIEMDRTAAEALGITWTVAPALSTVGPMLLAPSFVAPGVKLDPNFAAQFLATASKSSSRSLSRSRLLVTEGQMASLQVGESRPLARRSVSPQGTSAVTSYDNINSGILLSVEATSAGEKLQLTLKPEISQVIGEVDGAPILARRRVECVAVLSPPDTIIIGGLEAGSEDEGHQSGLPGLGPPLGARKSTKLNNRRVFVIVTAIERSNQCGWSITPNMGYGPHGSP